MDEYQDADNDEVPFDKLYPALIECFGVIICGYVAGRVGLIKEQQTNGLATFVGTFSLPCLIFLSLASLDLSAVNWYFLLSVFISKTIVFFSVLLITMLVTRPVDPGKSGLYAIFCTQSNDFAIGYPIVSTVYGVAHKDFISYLYLLAPINLVMLNPVGFTLMEISKSKNSTLRTGLPLRVFTSIATNPIVFMTALGIAGNFIFAHQVPDGLYALLNVFGQAFTASALFLLGLRMVGSVRNFKGEALLVPICLIAAKELMLPLVTREVSSLVLTWAQVPENETTALSTYGFLYGTIPSAPGVFVYSTNYGLEVKLIATAMVACTFVSAPLMFISAKMVSISHLSPPRTIALLTNFELDLCIIGVFACVILLAVFTFKRTVWSAPQKLTMCLLLSQLLGCTGVISGHLFLPYTKYVAYFLVNLADFSSRILTACLAICLAFMESRNYTTVNHFLPIFYGVSLGVPVFLILISSLLGDSFPPPPERTTLANSRFVETIDILVLLVSLIVSVVYMVLQQRYKRRYARYLVYSREANATSDSVHSCEDVSASRSEEQPVLPDGELDQSTTNEDSYPVHHLALVFFLVCSLFVSLALHIWNIVDDSMTGVYLELAFLDLFFTRGQSLIVLFIFGLDLISLMQPICRRIMETFSQGESITLPKIDEIPSETQHLCDQFNTYHIQPCQSQIVKRRRLKLWDFVACFTGEDLVSWLLSQGLVKDRDEGVVYGSHLLTGRVLRHINNTQYFTDDVALFVFNIN
ncbi:Membrane transport protein [Nesidiocoris tenuis]|uniref:Membrane transport protein n=1 Tax=Nesidiocoris tenuis TaxID=355587 RepID=A0ABN7A6N2_9HEMI|nr:Membrane transport protein [Nesidiocoris tenuis]